MTREEAIEVLNGILKLNYREWWDDKCDEAVEMAIEALSAEALPIHNDGTLKVKIPNAQKVGRVLVMDTNSHIGGGLFYPDDAEQGEWVEKEVMVDEDTNITEWQSARCSVCGKYHTTPFMYYFDDFNFCPNCGAKMGGERREP